MVINLNLRFFTFPPFNLPDNNYLSSHDLISKPPLTRLLYTCQKFIKAGHLCGGHLHEEEEDRGEMRFFN